MTTPIEKLAGAATGANETREPTPPSSFLQRHSSTIAFASLAAGVLFAIGAMVGIGSGKIRAGMLRGQLADRADEIERLKDGFSASEQSTASLKRQIAGQEKQIVRLGRDLSTAKEAVASMKADLVMPIRQDAVIGPELEEETYLETSLNQRLDAVVALWDSCGMIQPLDDQKNHVNRWGRWGLRSEELAAYIELVRRHLARGDTITDFRISWTPQPAHSIFHERFTHAQASLCVDDILQFANTYPTLYHEDGKPVPCIDMLIKMQRRTEPEDFAWHKSGLHRRR